MRRPYFLVTVGVAAMLATAPVQAAPLVIGLFAAGAVGLAFAANRQTSSQQQSPVMSYAPMPADRAASPAPRPVRHAVWAYTDKYGWVGGAREDVSALNTPLAPKPGTSQRLVSACRDAIARTAEPYNVASLEAVSAGKQTRVNGRTVAPIEVRAIYKIQGVHEVKRSTVRCEVDRGGRVIATI